ncbi:unnamed protein product, partial [Ascophyllum nodosum]
MKHSSLGGNSYVVIFMDDCTRFKVVKFVKKKSDTTAALLSLIADCITPQKLSIKCVRTNNSGEFEGTFQRELDRRSITHEHTPPDTPQYNGVAEQKLWAQAMLFACDVTNKSATTSTNGGKSPYELWFGKFPTADHLRPFEAVEYARQSVREHKMAPKGKKCVFMGIPRNLPTGTVSVLLVRTRNIVEWQALSDHEQEQQHQDGEAEPASGSSNLEGPALTALRKLTIDGNIPPILSSRTRSRRPHTNGVEGESLHYILPTIEAEEQNGVEDALACDDGGQMAMQATLDIPEPRNRRQAMESPEWNEWRKAEDTEMLGTVENCVYKQLARPKDKLVVGTKMLYKRNIGQDGKIEKYKCRFVAQGFWQVEGVHYTEKYS